jgi:hypothetical protein
MTSWRPRDVKKESDDVQIESRSFRIPYERFSTTHVLLEVPSLLSYTLVSFTGLFGNDLVQHERSREVSGS